MCAGIETLKLCAPGRMVGRRQELVSETVAHMAIYLVASVS